MNLNLLLCMQALNHSEDQVNPEILKFGGYGRSVDITMNSGVRKVHGRGFMNNFKLKELKYAEFYAIFSNCYERA